MTKKFFVDEKMTKSYVFLLPMLELEYGFISNNLANVYMEDHYRNDLKNKIFLLYNNEKTSQFVQFQNLIHSIPEYCESYIIDEYIMIVFNIPINYIKDYDIFINSKYSKFSEKLKKTIMKFHNLDSNSEIYKIMYKTEDRRKALSYSLSHADDGTPLIPVEISLEMEYSDVLYPEREIFRYPIK